MSGAGTVVVGSGASAVHFALTLLRQGRAVTLVDVGNPRPAAVRPDLGLAAMKDTLEDPVDYFLGRDYEAVLFPGNADEYYGFPPNKAYIFRTAPQHRLRARGFAPLSSFAAGGLAEAWTGGSYPFNDAELADWPIGADALMPWYGEIARRIGICGAEDDLARFMPVHENLGAPLRLDEHAGRLASRYDEKRARINDRYGCWMGRSRLAVISGDRPDATSPGGVRKGCCYLGRCLWGCPTDSLWTPGITLRECRGFDTFTYLPGRFVSHFRFDSARRITHIVTEPAAGTGNPEEIPADRLVLAAGTISSCRIFLESILRGAGERVTLHGLMDNRQILMPFVNIGMIGRPWDPETYQYHQLALGLTGPAPKEYIHGLVTTLKTALIHPIVQNVPTDLRTALAIFRSVHAALGLVNINFSDSRRTDNTLSLEPDDTAGGDTLRLVVRYSPEAGEPARLRETCARMKKVLRALGCIVPPGMTHVRPMGASVHYAGLLPMSTGAAPLTTTPECRSNDFTNLWVVDGSTLPFVPAKNLTFTLMANAARVAAAAF